MVESTTITTPIVKKVVVGVSVESAFTLFTRDMGRWWPLDTHSIAADTFEGRVNATGLVFEEAKGGRIYETMSDGQEGDWGQVLVWEPPLRVVFSWKPTLEKGPFTEIEVRFTPVGNKTEVELEHRGWHQLGGAAAAKRSGYETGWPGVLEAFRSLSEE